MATVVLPLRGGGGTSLRSDASPEDVIPLLRRERPPPEAWLDAARSFLVEGNAPAYEAILRELCDGQQAGSSLPFALVQAHCALAAWLCHQARSQATGPARQKLFDQASSLLFAARQGALDDALPLLGLGQLALDRGNAAAARQHFQQAAKHAIGGRPNAAPQLALAALEFGEGRPREALSLYKSVLKGWPAAPAEVRLGIAACRFRLGDVRGARRAFVRVLQLDGGCAAAMLGAAVLRLGAGGAEDAAEGSRLLVRAFERDPENPHVLALLAYFSLQQGFHEAALRLANAALARAETDQVRAECFTLLARAAHALQRPKEAYQHYRAATALDPRAPLPRLGLGQFAVLQGEHGNAASLLESALEALPAWTDALEARGGGGILGGGMKARERGSGMNRQLCSAYVCVSTCCC